MLRQRRGGAGAARRVDVSDQEGAAALNDVPNVFAEGVASDACTISRGGATQEAKLGQRRGGAGAAGREERAVGCEASYRKWIHTLSRSGPETNVRIAKGIRVRHACGEGARAESLSRQRALRWSTRQRVCVSKLHGHRYNEG